MCHQKFRDKAQQRNYRMYVHKKYGKRPLNLGSKNADVIPIREPTVKEQLTSTQQKLDKQIQELVELATKIRSYRERGPKV